MYFRKILLRSDLKLKLCTYLKRERTNEKQNLEISGNIRQYDKEEKVFFVPDVSYRTQKMGGLYFPEEQNQARNYRSAGQNSFKTRGFCLRG